MSEPTNAPALARELLALRQKATQGEWKHGYDPAHFDAPEVLTLAWSVYIPTIEDAVFIAAAANNCEPICTALVEAEARIVALRTALIETVHNAGGACTENVSDEFLCLVPGEVKACIAAQRSPEWLAMAEAAIAYCNENDTMFRQDKFDIYYEMRAACLAAKGESA